MKLPRPLRAPRTIARRTVSAFAGCGVCESAGLRLLSGTTVSRFEDEIWDLRGLADKARSISPGELLWDFSAIINPVWRVVTKEILLALMAPHHDSVIACSHALRKLRSPRTCKRFLTRYTTWFNWLTAQGVTALEDVTQEHCDRFIDAQQWRVPAPGQPRRQVEPETLAESVRIVQLVTLYGELLSTDSYRAGFIPWDGRSTLDVVGGRWLRANRTPSAPDRVLQPLLATCLYLVQNVGPLLVDVVERRRADTTAGKDFPFGTMAHLPALRDVAAQMRAAREPLPEGVGGARRNNADLGILNRLAWNRLALRVGVKDISSAHLRPHIVPELTDLAHDVGFAGAWGRDATAVVRADNAQPTPWTAPMNDAEVDSMIANVLTACVVVTSALTGMRNCELLELSVGCRRRTQVAGGIRYRLAGRLIKGKGMGGVPDEWVVIEEVDHTVALAEALLGTAPGSALYGSINLTTRIRRLRRWLEDTGNRERWGLPVIPEGPVSARMLRRTLALSIARRPGGLLAAKIALKHISVATTEGYAAQPGGSQRLFLAEAEEA